jgi:hypothetical protein
MMMEARVARTGDPGFSISLLQAAPHATIGLEDDNGTNHDDETVPFLCRSPAAYGLLDASAKLGGLRKMQQSERSRP